MVLSYVMPESSNEVKSESAQTKLVLSMKLSVVSLINYNLVNLFVQMHLNDVYVRL